MTSRAKTKEEARTDLLNQIIGITKYWASLPGKTALERTSGTAFSILVIFDGGSMALPGMNISLQPHPDDKQFRMSEGSNWYEPDMVINDDCQLHELMVGLEDKKPEQETHKARHVELHKSLDELLADFVLHTGRRPSQTNLMELLSWSHEQTLLPTEGDGKAASLLRAIQTLEDSK